MYAVGRPHPLQDPSRRFFVESYKQHTQLGTSSEVLQELLHVLHPAGRLKHFDAVVDLIARFEITLWSLDADDVVLAREIANDFPELSARDLCHLANCRRRNVASIKTFAKGLFAASTAG